MQPLCVFVHMPKTGGSTLQEIIQRHYSPAVTIDVHGDSMETVQSSVDRLRQMTEPEREKIACVKGHIFFGIHRWLPRSPRYVTMLRDPVQRIVSDYFFAVNTPRHTLFERMRRDRPSLKDFVVMRHEEGLGNIYSRLLNEPVNWNDVADSPCTLPSSALRTAKDNLERNFSVIGITERFDESLLLMQTAFDWKEVRYERANVTRDKPTQVTLTGEALDAIRLYNGQDIELYEFSRQRLDERIAEGGARFVARVRRFRRENERHQRWRRLRRGVVRRLPSPVMRAIRTLRGGSQQSEAGADPA